MQRGLFTSGAFFHLQKWQCRFLFRHGSSEHISKRLVLQGCRGGLAGKSWFPLLVEIGSVITVLLLVLLVCLVFGGKGLRERALIIVPRCPPWHPLSCCTTKPFSCWLTAIPLSSELCSCWFTSDSIPTISCWLTLLSHFIVGFLLEMNRAPCSYIQPICQLKTSIFSIWTWIIHQPKVHSYKRTEVSLCFLYSWLHKTHQSICISVDKVRPRAGQVVIKS